MCSVLPQFMNMCKLTLGITSQLQASAFVVTYPVNNAIDEQGNKKAVAWEKAFIKLVEV